MGIEKQVFKKKKKKFLIDTLIFLIPKYYICNMKNTVRHNNKRELKAQRKELRNFGTSAEALLWLSLKNKQIEGVRFRRQFSVGDFILDFYSPQCKLGIELDGVQHYSLDGTDYDDRRSRWLQKHHGIHIIRFENRDVFTSYDNVVGYIREVVLGILEKGVEE